MNIYKYSLGLGLAFAAALSSCDNIADNPEDRFIPVDRIESSRNVLIQEFSGQRCVNCPNGAAAIASMTESYGSNIVPMTMHPDNTIFTMPMGSETDLISEIATEYYKFYKSPDSFPCAIFDGHLTNNSTNIQKWEDDAKEALAEGSSANIDLIANYDDMSRQVTVNYSVTFSHDYQERLDIVVWVVESGIVAPQMSLTGTIRDYVNNHILRASLNGTWGEKLADGGNYKMNQEYRGTVTGEMSLKWVPSNCEIVVALLHPDTKYVEQAQQCHIF